MALLLWLLIPTALVIICGAAVNRRPSKRTMPHDIRSGQAMLDQRQAQKQTVKAFEQAHQRSLGSWYDH